MFAVYSWAWVHCTADVRLLSSQQRESLHPEPVSSLFPKASWALGNHVSGFCGPTLLHFRNSKLYLHAHEYESFVFSLRRKKNFYLQTSTESSQPSIVAWLLSFPSSKGSALLGTNMNLSLEKGQRRFPWTHYSQDRSGAMEEEQQPKAGKPFRKTPVRTPPANFKRSDLSVEAPGINLMKVALLS